VRVGALIQADIPHVHHSEFSHLSRHRRALLSVWGRCSFGGLGCCSCRLRVCVSVSGVLFSVGVCVCV